MAETVGQLDIAISFNTKSMDKGLGEVEQKAGKTGQIMQTAMGMLAANAVQGTISKVGDLAKSVIDVGSSFESSMSEVAAISGATGKDLELLEKTARDFGASTRFSATEASQALKYMSLAGWDANQSASALGGVLDLAAASGMDLAQASDLVTDYLSAFGMQAEQSAEFADMLAYAQSNSNTTAAQLGEAYRNSAANLSAAGQDVQTVTSLLAVMADQGLKGSEAGTALNAVMRDMTAKMKDGAIAIGDTKVQVMDANGNYRDMTDILRDVESATAGMGDAERAAALSATFTADSIRGVNLIMGAGVDKAAEFEEALRNSDGTAGEMADTMNNNLNGRLQELRSKLEEVALKVYNAVQPALEAGIKIAGGFADAIGWAIENADKIIPVLGGLAAGVTAYTVVTKGAMIASQAWTKATNLAKAAQTAFNAVMNMSPLGLIVAGITAVITALGILYANSEEFRNFVGGLLEQVGQFFGWMGQKLGEFGQAAGEVFNGIGTFVGEVVNNIVGFFSGMWTTIMGIFSAIGEFFVNVFSVPIAIVQKIIEIVMKLGEIIGVVVYSTIAVAIEWLIGLFTGLWEWLLGGLTMASEFFGSIFEGIWNVISGVVENVKNAFQGAWEFITGIFGGVGDWFKEKFTAAYNGVKSAFDNVVNFFKGVWDKIVEIFTGIAESVGNAVKNALATAINAVLTAIETVINWGIDLINGLIDGVNAIADVVGIHIGHLSRLSLGRVQFAQGGIVPGTEYYGDRVPAMMNSGEMVLTRGQQGALWKAIQSGEFGGNASEPSDTGIDTFAASIARSFAAEVLADDDDELEDRTLTVYMENNIDNELDAEQVGELMLESIRRAV